MLNIYIAYVSAFPFLTSKKIKKALQFDSDNVLKGNTAREIVLLAMRELIKNDNNMHDWNGNARNDETQLYNMFGLLPRICRDIAETI